MLKEKWCQIHFWYNKSFYFVCTVPPRILRSNHLTFCVCIGAQRHSARTHQELSLHSRGWIKHVKLARVHCSGKYSDAGAKCCHVLVLQPHSAFPSPQDCAPYDKGAFRVELIFPAEYPFKPPRITFKTKIYHPNIDEKGQVCLPIISAENWKPATRTDQGKSVAPRCSALKQFNVI